jgi:cyclopropane fatty-acyl-phospholipid synthase-like methyltransferase
MFNNTHLKNQNTLTQKVYDYYNNKKQDRNLIQAKDGYVHHHFGLGNVNLKEYNTETITSEIQRLENNLTKKLIKLLNYDNDSETNTIDIGCGRGGNMFTIANLYSKSKIDGINITHYQTDYCNELIKKYNLQNRLEVRQANFLSMPYGDETFSHAYCCEVTQYAINLNNLFEETYRVLKKNGNSNLVL